MRRPGKGETTVTAGRGERQGTRELESEVLAALWATGRALTAAEIQAETGDDLARDTLSVILQHLGEQDLVRPAPDTDRAYEPVRNAAEMTAEVMRQVLDRKHAAGRGAPSPDAPAPQLVPRPRRRPWGIRAARNTPARQSPSPPVPPASCQGDPSRCPHTSQS